jgi:predicted RNase H-like HicB family nuclease
MKDFKYTVIFEPAEEGGYVVHVPALPGLVTEGDTLEEAKKMARDAIRCHLLSLMQRNRPIPEERHHEKPVMEELAVAI